MEETPTDTVRRFESRNNSNDGTDGTIDALPALYVTHSVPEPSLLLPLAAAVAPIDRPWCKAKERRAREMAEAMRPAGARPRRAGRSGCSRFESRHNSNDGTNGTIDALPALLVTYTAVPEPSLLWPLAGMVTVLYGPRRRESVRKP